ncbi:uncharacterized protein [Argopecten irradians]|uniref:uncharacterized protein n=1 Tax=Argopecten irradians TaxID=31199 RepID=UPI0037103AD5
MEGHRISFLLKSTYDLLPSSTHLFTWGIKDNAECVLCRKPANLAHVLTSCQVALSDGRYTWRHDQVLKEVAASLDRARRKKRMISKGPKFVTFVKSETLATGRVEAGMILATARDWEMRADIQQRMGFPAEVASTPLRPDVVLWSRSSKQVVLVELTVPWEDRMEEADERKQQKYQQLVEECQHRGWKTWCLPIEVGCRGFPGQSLWRALRLLGVTGADRRDLISAVSRQKFLPVGSGLTGRSGLVTSNSARHKVTNSRRTDIAARGDEQAEIRQLPAITSSRCDSRPVPGLA